MLKLLGFWQPAPLSWGISAHVDASSDSSCPFSVVVVCKAYARSCK